MTREESLQITARIGRIIAETAPRISLSPEERKHAAETDGAKRKELEKDGFDCDDFELFSAVFQFVNQTDLWKTMDKAYLRALLASAKKLDAAAFRADPYLSGVKVQERRLGNFLLTENCYEKGELFQYEMPDLEAEIVVPKLGFFTERVTFPAIYEGNVPWVSVCPSEIRSMAPDTEGVFGRVLVLGLGLGYYPYFISAKPEVKEITIVERSPEICRLFREELLPQFPHKEKIRLVCRDAFDFLEDTENGRFDFCYADIWEGWADGAEAVKKIRVHAARLYDTVFRYWIEKEIDWFLREGS